MKIPDKLIIKGRGNKGGKEIEKKYFVNMTSDSKKIHITGCTKCPNSSCAFEYIEFDSVEKAREFFKKYGKDISKCEHCFD